MVIRGVQTRTVERSLYLHGRNWNHPRSLRPASRRRAPPLGGRPRHAARSAERRTRGERRGDGAGRSVPRKRSGSEVGVL